MEKPISVDPRSTLPGVRLFAGFPYLITRLGPALYHVLLLPQDRSLWLLRATGASQAQLNALPTCLVLDNDSCYYYGPDGHATQDTQPPRRGWICFGKLRPFREFPLTAELAKRKRRLESFAGQPNLWLFGDLTKGGHKANDEEIVRLAGRQEQGVPVGLTRCTDCGQWKGQCLDPNPKFANQVMTAHCACDNINLCAGCGQLLYPHKLNANFFDESDGQIWHLPGFCTFSHQCPGVLQ